MSVTAISDVSTAEQARLFALLADPLRLQIIRLLAAEDLCTCHLVEATSAKQTTISHHLRILRQAGAVTATEQGRFTWYRLAPAWTERVRSHVKPLLPARPEHVRSTAACE